MARAETSAISLTRSMTSMPPASSSWTTASPSIARRATGKWLLCVRPTTCRWSFCKKARHWRPRPLGTPWAIPDTGSSKLLRSAFDPFDHQLEHLLARQPGRNHLEYPHANDARRPQEGMARPIHSGIQSHRHAGHLEILVQMTDAGLVAGRV